jgi:hypothetical protein
LYRQNDGYLSGHGRELAAFLDGMRIVTGLGFERERVANGAGCLAAQMIAKFKTEPGEFYIIPISVTESDEDMLDTDYVYNVHVNAGEITVTVVGSEQEFQGTATEFFDYCAAAGRAE